jgi:hypothetical protein
MSVVFDGRIRSKRKEMEKLDSENLKILARLQDVHSSYDSLKWSEERQKIEKEI